MLLPRTATATKRPASCARELTRTRNVLPCRDVRLSAEQRPRIFDRSAAGNAYIAEQCGLPLWEYGDPLHGNESFA
jgi:hypothetical protein